jgi:hypothetical protein
VQGTQTRPAKGTKKVAQRPPRPPRNVDPVFTAKLVALLQTHWQVEADIPEGKITIRREKGGTCHLFVPEG